MRGPIMRQNRVSHAASRRQPAGGESVTRGRTVVATVFMVATFAAACSDPAGPELRPNFSQTMLAAGDPEAAPPPDVQFSVEPDGVEICASWSGDPLAAGTRLYYSYYLLNAGGDWQELGSARARHNMTVGCLHTVALGEGTHAVRIIATARLAGGPNELIIRTEPSDVEIVVGDPGPPAVLYTVEISPDHTGIYAGQSQQFTATIFADGEEVEDDPPALAWTSVEPSIATVSSSGLATGVGEGTGTIRVTLATDAGVFAEAHLMVEIPPDPIVSDFETDAEGWTHMGDVSTYITHLASGGNPNAYIRLREPGRGTTDRFVAPGKFLGNLAEYYGATLRYDLRVSDVSSPVPAPNDNVILSGGGLTLYGSLPLLTIAGVWDTLAISLDESGGWRVASGIGELATAAQIQAVLADVTSLWILADYRFGSELIDLDNVTIAMDGAL